ncbi:unnamed protein product [Boreogadus saida]
MCCVRNSYCAAPVWNMTDGRYCDGDVIGWLLVELRQSQHVRAECVTWGAVEDLMPGVSRYWGRHLARDLL